MSGTLVSPGVRVTIVDESFYAGAGPGTIPLVVFATANNKPAPSGTGIAPGTVSGAAGQLYLAISQRDAITQFGTPEFTMYQGTAVQGDELNEYGLHAAYSYLGISNRCYMLRAAIDLAQLAPSTSPPQGPPLPGTYWLNISTSKWGLFQSLGLDIAGSTWVPVTVLIPTLAQINPNTDIPLPTFGVNGNFAVVPWTDENLIYQNINGIWYQIGTTNWAKQFPTQVLGSSQVGINPDPLSPNDTFFINSITITVPAVPNNNMSGVMSAINGANIPNVSATISNNSLLISNIVGGSLLIADGISAATPPLETLGISTGTFNGITVTMNSSAAWPSGSVVGSLWVKGNPANNGAAWTFSYYSSATKQWVSMIAPFYQFNSLVLDNTANKDQAATAALGAIPMTGTIYVGFDPNTGVQQPRYWNSTYWEALTYEPSSIPPFTEPAAGTYYYNDTPLADVMVTNGEQWYGYRHMYPYTDSSGPILSGSAPTQQVSGHIPPGGTTVATGTASPATLTTGDTFSIDGVKITVVAPGTLTSIVNAINSAHIPEVTAAIYNSALMITDATAANLVIVNIAGKALTTLGLAAQTYTATLSYSLVDNDLWIDTSDLENYPMIYRYAAATSTWTLIDNTDHTTPFGIIFDDARQDSGAPYLIQGVPNTASYTYYSRSIFDMMLSDYVDPDAPNADAHPAGVIMFNTRYATGDVKVWTPNYFKAGGYDPNTDYTLNTWTNGGNPNVVFQPLTDPDRWVSASGLATDLTAYMLRKAQRQMVVKAMIAEVENNQDIRSELVYFNLMTAPGYPELMSTMVTLNTDQNDVSFIVGDTPIRLPSNGTAIQNWAKNAGNVAATGEDGLTLSDNYVGIYYPWGLGTDLSGNEVMIPPSTVALVTIGYNDQVAYPWFAPAGFNRGLVSNATSVGYLANDGTYKPVILNQGQRDVLYTNQINPIAYIPGRGLVVYGQKTLGAPTSMLDRINVARLCNYIAYNLDLITKPYLFEQNDSITQKAATNTVSSFFNSLVGLRAISDYGVLCDSTNNTPDRVAANQLWIDCFVVPISAVEFIYIPVRILISTAASVSALGKPV